MGQILSSALQLTYLLLYLDVGFWNSADFLSQKHVLCSTVINVIKGLLNPAVIS